MGVQKQDLIVTPPSDGSKILPKSDTYTKPKYVDEEAYIGINLLSTFFIVVPPILLIYGLTTTDIQLKTGIFALIYYFCCGVSITGGYHRLWSHRCFHASLPLRIFFACFGAGALEGSAKWWCRGHRAHHRFTDTPKDPYNVRKGFFWAHVGWMIFKRDYKYIGNADISDLRRDRVFMFQSNNYIFFALFFGFFLSTFIPGYFWGDYWGGFYYATLARAVFVHHATFCVNSLAHTVGEQTFSDYHSAVDSIITAIATLGEGYHNYHHEFPNDYRNGIRWFHYDPTKWFIRVCSLFGLAYDLKAWPSSEINKAILQMKKRKLESVLQNIKYPTIADLPIISKSDFAEAIGRGKKLVILRNRVVDVSSLLSIEYGLHPGGPAILSKHIGQDVTTTFYGETGPHHHSYTAEQLMKTYTVGLVAQE